MDDEQITDPSGGQADDDIVQTFQLESSHLRGRIVRLGGVLQDILDPHGYPQPVAHLVAETVTLSVLLSSMLKYDGIFTLQAQGDGPVRMLVSDMSSAGEVRGCAHFDSERVRHAREQLAALKKTESSQNHFAQLLGKGHMAFTVDPDGAAERYQGIVDLNGASVVECVRHYFTQSEQIGTGIKMAVGQRGGLWRAGGIMLQHMPEDERNPAQGSGNLDEDDWRRAMILLDSCTAEEFLDSGLHPNDLLTRLFHEEGIRVYTPRSVTKGCRCDRKKVEDVLCIMPEEDRRCMAIDGKISMHCEFCSRDFVFDPKTVERTIGKRRRKAKDSIG